MSQKYLYVFTRPPGLSRLVHMNIRSKEHLIEDNKEEESWVLDIAKASVLPPKEAAEVFIISLALSSITFV